MSNSVIPQWKKDLIARLRSQNKRTANAQQQLFGVSRSVPPSTSAVQQPVADGRGEKCECASTMVQERCWSLADKSDSDEDLHYGPGIVSKLKERYLSLAQREKPRPRPSILRKATSLENILDDAPAEPNRLFQASQNKTVPNRYAKRGSELKRARSVETISSSDDLKINNKEPKRESLHEEMLIRGSLIIEKPPENVENKFSRINRPKRIAPVMNEREKPPADVVKQTKMIFERRPEKRTKPPQQTGEVAAKVATYKNIIVQNKPKKPTIKVKPVIGDKPKTNGIKFKTKAADREGPRSPDSRPFSPDKKETFRPKSPVTPPRSPTKKFNDVVKNSLEKKNSVDVPPSPKNSLEELKFSSDGDCGKSSEKSTNSLPSPIPDISRVDVIVEENGLNSTNLTETPDLIITSSPLPVVNSPSFRISATENFIKEEIRLAETERSPSCSIKSEPPLSPPKKPQSPSTPPTANSTTFNFAKSNNLAKIQNHLPTVNKNVLNTQTPPSQPLKLEINGVNSSSNISNESSSTITTKKTQQKPTTPTDNETLQSQILVSPKPTLTTLEIEKNLINTAKTLQQPKSTSVITKLSVNEVTAIVNKVPKVKKPPRELENNSIVFNFSDRKDVPDYVHNDGVTRIAKLEKPKVGEGGIILLPGASVGESFTDEDDEIMRSLECPPSPCDVTFINDNILIDGKSSLSQKTKKAKLKISFVDEGPEVYEYPSESSLLIEDSPVSPPVAQQRHSVPVTGSLSLANYTPKSTEDFQPGITRSMQNSVVSKPENSETADLILQDVEKPILFSAGANSDILF